MNQLPFVEQFIAAVEGLVRTRGYMAVRDPRAAPDGQAVLAVHGPRIVAWVSCKPAAQAQRHYSIAVGTTHEPLLPAACAASMDDSGPRQVLAALDGVLPVVRPGPDPVADVVIAMAEPGFSQIFSSAPLRVLLVNRLDRRDPGAVRVRLPDADDDFCEIRRLDDYCVSPPFAAAYFAAVDR